MKKVSRVLVVVLIVIGCMASFVGCVPRNEVLKIYNWGEYMSDEAKDGFKDWYFEETGEKITVKYKEFSTNEDMFIQIAEKKKDYDLVCPSDYMMERMIKANLVKELDKNIFDITKVGIVPELLELTKSYDADNKYSVPYMWGTFGIMYDTSNDLVDVNDMNSWDALFSEKYKKEIFMKDSVRDVYAVTSIYKDKQALSDLSTGFTYYNDAYKVKLNEGFKMSSDATVASKNIADIKKIMMDQKPLVKKYEVDEGKDDMLNGNGTLGLFWSCDAGYVMNDIEVEAKGCVSAKTIKGNKNLFYTVPKEGSNVWLDGFVIPKYAKNEKAANYFLKYLCQTDVALLNTKYVGSSTPIVTTADMHKAELSINGFFDGTKEGFKQMYLDMMFPPKIVLDRCAIMSDFGEYNTTLGDVWIDVKAS